MKKEMIEFIEKNGLSPFNKYKTQIKSSEENIYKTKDAKIVHNKVLSSLSDNFIFPETANMFNFFPFSSNLSDIAQRQGYFKSIEKSENSFLSSLRAPKNWWKPKYGIVAVTEDEKTFNELQKLECPTKFLITESDLDSLDDYDIVQVIDCK